MLPNTKIKLAIIDDNEFYSQLLAVRLKNYIYPIAEDKHFELDVKSFTDPYEGLKKMDRDTDIVFLDYYLGPYTNGQTIMKRIKKHCSSSNIVIISQVKSLQTSLVTLLEGASEFILKDRHAFTRSCYVAEEMIYNRLKYT